MPWSCARCGEIHRHNPGKCKGCDHTVFNTVTFEHLADQADEFDSAKPMKMKRENVMGTAPEPSELGVKGPDVNLDGSISKPEGSEQVAEPDEPTTGILSRVRHALDF